jgi:hypothetical protein
MNASLGRIVLVRVDPHTNSGSDVAPAVINRVWGGHTRPSGAAAETVDVSVFLNSPTGPQQKTSVCLFADADTALADAIVGTVAWWPPRT